MKLSFKLLPVILIFAVAATLFQACHKTETKPVTTPAAPSEVLVAPFPNLSPAGDFSTGALVKMNYTGQITKQVNFSAAVFNFRRWTINGKIVYSYCLYDTIPAPPFLGWLAGTDIVTDANLNPIQSIQLIGHPGHDARVDGHEFILLGPTHYIVETYYSQVPTNIPDSVPHAAGCTVLAPFIQEVNNGQVVFEWNAANYPEFYAASVEGGNFTNTTTPQDYMHMNSIVIDPKDNNLIVSFRQTDQIIKINRVTGAIMWRLGNNSDFPMTASEQFLRQHDATISGDTLMLIDNGLAVTRPYTRIDEFVLNEASKTITSFKATLLPAATPFITYMGSVQKANNVYFVGGGTIPMNFEINATTGALISEQALVSNSYRAYKY